MDSQLQSQGANVNVNRASKSEGKWVRVAQPHAQAQAPVQDFRQSQPGVAVTKNEKGIEVDPHFEVRYVDSVVAVRRGGGVNQASGDDTPIVTGFHPEDFRHDHDHGSVHSFSLQGKTKEPILHGPVEFVHGLSSSASSAETKVKSMRDAQEVADAVLDNLEIQLGEFFTEHELVQKKPAVGRPSEVGSIRSSLIMNLESSDGGRGVYALDEPSTMDLFYERHDPGDDLRTRPLSPLEELGEDSRADAECQVRIHRHRLRRPSEESGEFGPDNEERGTQTRDMTFVKDGARAELIFRKMYPNPDDYKPPSQPSRKASLEKDVVSAKGESGDVDRAKVGVKVKWNRKPRVLPPLPQDYHKVESFWTGSTFAGKYEGRQFEHGLFNYPLMSTYESEFKHGVIQTKKHRGIVVYPRGDTFEGDWSRGRYMAGRITFEDGLQFSPHNWKYLESPDRRFFIEQDIGVKQAGRVLYNNHMPPPKIPPGMYDACDGVYDPETRTVTSYNGLKLRTAKRAEHEFILDHYRQVKVVQDRYTPAFHVDRLPCSYVESMDMRVGLVEVGQ